MRNKILIGIAILLAVFAIWVRYEFKNRFSSFKTAVLEHESEQLKKFKNEKQTRLSLLAEDDKMLYDLFNHQFDENKSMAIRDTSFSFLYLNETIKYTLPQLSYIECLNQKCVIDKKNDISLKLIAEKE